MEDIGKKKFSNIKINEVNILWVCLFFGALLYAVINISYILYFVFLVQALKLLFNVARNSSVDKTIIDLSFCAILLPDNYSIIAVAIVVALRLLFTRRVTRASRLFVYFALFLFINLLLNCLLHSIHVVNMLFSIIYVFPFFAFGAFFKKFFEKKSSAESDFIIARLKGFIFLQICAIVLWAVSHIGTVMQYSDMDWVTGTLGMYQCNVLMCLSTLSSIVFLCQYVYFKYIKDLVWSLLALTVTICTGAFMYTAILLVACLIVLLTDSKGKKSANIKGILFLFIICAILIFLLFLPNWMIAEVKKLFHADYLLQRVVKLRYYHSTFVAFPREQGIFRFLIGIGPGEFTSRAADTCAGGYVSLYDKLFSARQNPLRLQYVSTIANFYLGEGLASTSQSSILSVTGEFGLIGLIFLVIYCFRHYRKTNLFSKLCILFFFGLLFVDNALEFAKYDCFLWLAYYTCGAIKRKYEETFVKCQNKKGAC